MAIKNVTGFVTFENNDDEFLPLTEYVCGQKFNAWDFQLGVYKDDPTECPNCKRKLFFSFSLQVYEVTE